MRNYKTPRNSTMPADRRRIILRLAQENESVVATELADMLGVGISTIRRDLDSLHEQGKLLRVHGGAIVKEGAVPRTPYVQSRNQHMEEKSAVAQAALEFFPKTGTVFIGGGTTAYQLATKIPTGSDITLVTNALDVAMQASSRNLATVDVVGGTLRRDSPQTNCEDTLRTLYWNITFMSPAAIDIRRGITTENRDAARQEQLIIEHGAKFVVMCDSSKIGRFAYAQVAPVSVIDVFITDSGADPDFIEQMRAEGVEVVVAPVERAAPATDGNS